MKKIKFLVLAFVTLLLGILGITTNRSYAANIDGFLVNVDKKITVNEAIDLEIKAVKNGTIVKDYDGTIFIKIEGLSSNYATIPSNGVYLFTLADQGKKLFSKGLKITKPGTYTLSIDDLSDSSIISKTTIIVQSAENNENNIKTIDIVSPVDGGTEFNDTLDIIGSSIELPNTPVQIYLNSKIVATVNTDPTGEFTSKVTLTKTGENLLEIKAFNLGKQLIGKSTVRTFTVEKNKKTATIQEVIVEPSTTVEKSDKISITLKTREDINIASILLGPDNSFQMDKKSIGVFKKEFLAKQAGEIKLKFMVVENGEEKIFDKNTVITVNQVDGGSFHKSGTGEKVSGGSLAEKTINTIGDVFITPSNVDGTTIDITWQHTGDAKKFMVAYGTEKTTLEENIIVDTTGINVEKLTPGITYFFQIIPLNTNEDTDGKPSSIVEYTIGQQESCAVANISLQTEKINGKNYLTRNTVEKAKKYEIYRIDNATKKTTISDMSKIGETIDTKFEYPFDLSTKQEKYAYYAVQAICEGGQKIQVGNIEKVKTGPFDNILVILILSGLLFSMYKLHKTTS